MEKINELIKALKKIQKSQPDTIGITTTEYAEAQGISASTAKRHMRLLLNAGILKPSRVARVNAWGITQTVCGYEKGKS